MSPGRVWKYGDDVNTDVIYPGRYTYQIMPPEEMARHALGPAADRERETVEIGHDRKDRFIGDVVTDEERLAAVERRMRHQLAHARRLG